MKKLKIFVDLKSLFFNTSGCVIDSFISSLHYRFTQLILLVLSIVVTARQFLGDPIDCISKDDIPTELLDTYCWIHTTFSVDSAWFKEVGKEIPYPGVDKHTPGEKRVYHAYYQWVCFALFLQSLLFYVPRYLWLDIENHKMRHLVKEFNSPVVNAEWKWVKNKKTEQMELKPNEDTVQLVNYLFENRTLHNFYAGAFYASQWLNFLNVVVQIFLMDIFLGGEFTTYGTKVLSFSQWDYTSRYDPMIRVFPRMTKCTFHRYGSSGDVQKHDAMCLLPINILNEKIYIFLWFWFIILAALTGLELVYRAVGVFSEKFRMYVLRNKCRKVNVEDLERVLDNMDKHDWMVLSMLCDNVTPSNFKIIMRDLAKRMREELPTSKNLEANLEKRKKQREAFKTKQV